MTGFYYSHDGYWDEGYMYSGYKTKIECANTCTKDCFGIHTYAIANYYYTANCYHYSNRAVLVNTNVKISSGSKAYIKCSVPMNEGTVSNSKFCDSIC